MRLILTIIVFIKEQKLEKQCLYIYIYETLVKKEIHVTLFEREKKNEHKDVKRKLKKCPRFTNTK